MQFNPSILFSPCAGTPSAVVQCAKFFFGNWYSDYFETVREHFQAKSRFSQNSFLSPLLESCAQCAKFSWESVLSAVRDLTLFPKMPILDQTKLEEEKIHILFDKISQF